MARNPQSFVFGDGEQTAERDIHPFIVRSMSGESSVKELNSEHVPQKKENEFLNNSFRKYNYKEFCAKYPSYVLFNTLIMNNIFLTL